MKAIHIIFMVILFTEASSRYQAHLRKEKDLTTWITHLGCFMATSMEGNTGVKTNDLVNNNPGICSRQCGNWPYFALSKNCCFCFKPDVFHHMRETTRNECYSRCPNTYYSMYCGSTNKKFYTVYERNTELTLNGRSNCLARMKQEDRLQSVNCDEELQFICKTPAGLRIQQTQRSFYQAKVFCENNGGRLTTFTEQMPQQCEFKTLYWMGTFRQNLTANVDDGKTTILPRYSSKSSMVSTTQDYTEITTSLERLTTLIQTTKEITTEPSTLLTKKNVTTMDVISEKIIASKDTDSANDLACGKYCLILGVCFCCVTILALVVCLFKIRQQWNIRVHKNITVPHATKEDTADVEARERIPVYLDPATQTAVFHKHKVDTVNQHIYDEADIYNKAAHIPIRANCVSGYQELNFASKCEDKAMNVPVLTNDQVDTRSYNAPWDIFEVQRKAVLTNDTEKTRPHYSAPWDIFNGKGRHGKSDGTQQTNDNTALGFHSIILKKQEPSKDLQYEDTSINHKKFLYDEPLQKTLPLKSSNYQSLIKTEGRSASWGLSSERGFRLGTSMPPVSSSSSQPDIIAHENMTNKDDDRVYEIPVVAEESTKRAKLRKLKSRLAESKISKSLRKYRKRKTSSGTDGTYAMPNPVNPPIRSSEPCPVGANTVSSQETKMKYPVYEIPMSPMSSADNPIAQRNKGSKIPFQYEIAKPVGINTKENESRRNFKHGNFQYELAFTSKESSDNVSENDKTNDPIYFQPIT